MAFAWNQNLSVGFAEIDQQHQELFRRVNQLLEATSRGQGRDEIDKVIAFLGDYVKSHFGMEERYMTKHNYPDVAAHKTQHADFAQEFALLKKTYEQEGTSTRMVILLQQKVCSWLLNHIGKTDKALGSFLMTKEKPANFARAS